MSLIDALGAQREAEEFYATVDAAVTPRERNLIIRAGERLLWAISWRVLLKLGLPLGALAAVAITIGGSQATQTTPPGVASEPAIEVVAREPGVQFQARQFVCDPATKVQPGMIQPDAVGPVLRFVREGNQETVDWSSAGYTNPTGTHYKPDNTSEDANFDAAAIKCARQLAEKAGIR